MGKMKEKQVACAIPQAQDEVGNKVPLGMEEPAPCSGAQRDITRLCAYCGQLCLQHGAETALVDQLTTRMGKAFGMQSVEVAISTTFIVVTTLSNGVCITTTRRSTDRGINMHVVAEVQKTVIMAEHGELDVSQVQARFANLAPLRYPRPVVVGMVAASCAAFAFLAGGDAPALGIAAIASGIAMYVRIQFAANHFNPLISFGAAAFTATLVAAFACKQGWSATPGIALASCVLFLVPGFPMVNAISDVLKGYTNTAIARWTIATLLTIFSCLGVIGALSIVGYQA